MTALLLIAHGSRQAEANDDLYNVAAALRRRGQVVVESFLELAEPAPEAMIRADSRMVGQALTNILKNASEAIAARRGADPSVAGQLKARLVVDDDQVAFEVEDNGIGLPAKDRDRLTEPYVTTREKGTGLGLAIVGRILEEHGGRIELRDASEKTPGARGAWMQLRFAAETIEAPDAPAEPQRATV